MSIQKSRIRGDESSRPAGSTRVPLSRRVDRLAGLLPEEALEDALKGLEPDEITGPGGLLTQLAGRVIETALGAELTEHLGHPPGGVPQGSQRAQRRRLKTVQTDLGAVRIKTPRDRDGSFEPRLVGKRQTRLAGPGREDPRPLRRRHDDPRHLRRTWPSSTASRSAATRSAASPTRCSTTSRRGAPGRWSAVYPIVYFDAMHVKVREDRSVRNLACYLALGVTCDGEREVLGIWWQETEGAKFWLAVLNDLRRRGVQDVLISCVDGLKGFPEAIEATFPAGLGADLRRPSHPRLAALRQLPRPQEGRLRAAPDLQRRQRRRRRWSSSSASTPSGASATPPRSAPGAPPGST